MLKAESKGLGADKLCLLGIEDPIAINGSGVWSVVFARSPDLNGTKCSCKDGEENEKRGGGVSGHGSWLPALALEVQVQICLQASLS